MNFHAFLWLLIPISDSLYTQRRHLRKIRSLKGLKLNKGDKSFKNSTINPYIKVLETKLSAAKPFDELGIVI